MRLAIVFLLPLAAGFAQTLTDRYTQVADRLTDAALADNDGYAQFAYLCDRIGNRLSGTPSLDRAVQWSVEQMKHDGLSNVRKIPVKIPHWVRGNESARLIAPENAPLHMIGLGMSVGTPPGGITADVVVVSDFHQLAQLGRGGVRGKIVLYNQAYRGYDETVVYRMAGPSRAAALGAVAVLVRSITPLAMQIPHTGTLSYDNAQPKIPAAAVTLEDAMMMARYSAQGIKVRVHLEMDAHFEPDVDSADVIGEIPGRELPEEVVVLGGHLDSWDVGRGAQDDGSGIMASLAAVSIVKKLGLRPRRTIRVVFWVNEENGGRGGEAYRRWIGNQVANQVAAIEMDEGAEAPRGFGYNSNPPPELRQIAKLLNRIGAGEILRGGGGTDIAPLTRDGVPSLDVRTVGTHYFDWHHTEADTLDKVDLNDFRRNIASLAVMSYVLADMPGRLGGVMPKTPQQ